MRSRPLLRLEEKLEGERALLEALAPRGEGRRVAVAAASAAMLLATLAFVPIPAAVSPPDAGVGSSGTWATLVRWMPAPRPPALPEPQPPVAAPAAAAREPISLDAFREPEPIPEPPAAAFRSAPVVREPDVPLGVPEPPPEPADASTTPEPDLPTFPPRIAPGGQVPPSYPRAARSLRLSGTVRVEAQVDASGTVTSVRILGTNRPGVGFEDAARKAVERWRFVPATRGSVPVPGTAVFDVEFEW